MSEGGLHPLGSLGHIVGGPERLEVRELETGSLVRLEGDVTELYVRIQDWNRWTGFYNLFSDKIGFLEETH